jgi:SAM-dependent methyltransferase
VSDIPEVMLARRRAVSARYLAGDGIEIGALHYPLWTDPARARVRYVDRLTVPELRAQYPELAAYDLVAVDVVDDGETLRTFADASLDFIVGNHMLEHCENPLGTLRSHLQKVRPGGILYYAVPDKRMSFDIERPLTPFAHLVRDDREGPEGSRVGHFREWAELVNKHRTPEARDANVRELLAKNYSIHFHVWDADAYADFLDRAREYLGGGFRIEHLAQNDTEIITVLRRDAAAR